MDSTHLHLILNHFPIIGSVIAVFILMYGSYRDYIPLQKVSLVLMVILAIIAIPVFLTGEPAGESVENLPGVTEALIEAHEEAAELAIWVMEFTGLLAFVALWLLTGQKKAANISVYLVILAGWLSFAMMARTGYLGGQIRHSEIRGDVAASAIQDQGAEGTSEEDDD